MRILVLSLTIVLGCWSCNSSDSQWKKAEGSSFQYKVISPEGEPTDRPLISYEDRVILHYWLYNEDQLVISSTQQDTPISLILPGKMHRNQFEEPLTFARVGDSLVMKVAYVDALEELSAYAESFSKGDIATIRYKVLEVEQREDRLKAMQEEVARQQGYASAAAMRQEQSQKRQQAPVILKQLQTHIEQYQKDELETQTSEGLQYLLHDEGAGAEITAEDTVAIYYIAALEENGKVIDNLFTNPKRYEFVVDQLTKLPEMMHRMVKVLKNGASATFFVPAQLAYGEKGSGQRIPPNSDLVFYLEVATLKKAQ